MNRFSMRNIIEILPNIDKNLERVLVEAERFAMIHRKVCNLDFIVHEILRFIGYAYIYYDVYFEWDALKYWCRSERFLTDSLVPKLDNGILDFLNSTEKENIISPIDFLELLIKKGRNSNSTIAKMSRFERYSLKKSIFELKLNLDVQTIRNKNGKCVIEIGYSKELDSRKVIGIKEKSCAI